MKQILSLSTEDPRCDEVAAFLHRRAKAEEETLSTFNSDALTALNRLADAGRLSYDTGEGEVTVHYTPSREANTSAAGAGDAAGLPSAVVKKQVAAFRRSAGAIFRFPHEDGEDRLEVFITDWSPCPVACAVAVHRDHPFTEGLDKGASGALFTGRFVRHPLTGDLLPVWIADWVKPHFGTGAVLVNPAHDATDMDFARRTGLPLRFGLVPEGYDGSPESWPEPPVIRAGQATRTGICDGLSADDAMARYFEILAERGLAERTQDVQAGQRPLGRLVADPGGGLRWDAARRRVARQGDGVAVRFESDGLLETALAISGETSASLVCPAGEQASALLFLRLLCFDLNGAPLEGAELHLVQKSQGAPPELDGELLRLSALVGAPLEQVVVLKQKVTDQVRSFLKAHSDLRASWAARREPEEAGNSPKSLRQAKAAMLAGDPSRAFGSLYALQKQIRKSTDNEKSATLAGYFAAAHVLTGAAAPADLDPPEVWKQL